VPMASNEAKNDSYSGEYKESLQLFCASSKTYVAGKVEFFSSWPWL